MARYRIQSVVEMTGVSAPTMRSWERRYGVPTPDRTASAYRLYSAEDIEVIRRMRDLCAAGTPASEAARMAVASQRSPNVQLEQLDPYQAATRRLLQDVHAFAPAAFEGNLRRALMLGSASEVYERVISPLMHHVGALWQQSAVSVAQEHAFSQIVETNLRDVLRLMQPTDSRRTMLLACFADEQHTFGLYGIGLRFVGWGYKTISLGARTPPEAVAHAVQQLQPDAVGLSTTIAPAQKILQPLLAAYSAACGVVPWVVGGPAAAAMSDAVQGAGGLVLDILDAGDGNGSETLRGRFEAFLRQAQSAH